MNFTSDNFDFYPIITNPDLTIEDVKDIFYEFIAFIAHKNNFILDQNVDSSIYYKNKYTLYDVVYIRQFNYDELPTMYSNIDIKTLLLGPEYNSLLYSAQSIFITNITSFQSFPREKERCIIKIILELEDINVEKFITFYKLYENCDITLK